MVSRVKLYSRLDALEDELRVRLVSHLNVAAIGKNDLVFCTTDFNPYKELKNNIDSETDELIKLGDQILVLREKLGESSDGTIAERICWYCRQWGAIGEHRRKSTQRLAQEFIQEMADAKI